MLALVLVRGNESKDMKTKVLLLFDNKPSKDRFGGFLDSVTTDLLNPCGGKSTTILTDSVSCVLLPKVALRVPLTSKNITKQPTFV